MVDININNKFDRSKFDMFCAKHHFEFPKAYMEYLRTYNDGELQSNCIELQQCATNIKYFYGTSNKEYCDLICTYEVYKDRIPSNCVPIATDDFGNQFCISLRTNTYGKIYFWDHETMDVEDDEKISLKIDDMICVANSFEELCAKINPIDVADIPHYSWIQIKWNRIVSWLRTQWNKF